MQAKTTNHAVGVATGPLFPTPVNHELTLSTIPVKDIASYLKGKDFIVIAEGETVHDNAEVVREIESEGYAVIDEDDLPDEDDGEEMVEIRLTGSIVDEDIKEALLAAYEKHGYKLAQVLSTL